MLYSLLILLAAASRLVPHPSNVAPIAALALFAGAAGFQNQSKLGKAGVYLLPVIAMLVSDYFIGFYTWQVMLAVYTGFGLTVLLGTYLRKHYNWAAVVAASLIGSIIFFLITNAAVWAFTPMYTKDITGLMESYIAALPFFRNSLLGDLLYTGALFSMYELVRRYQPATQSNAHAAKL